MLIRVLYIAPDESFSSVRQPLSVSQRLGSYLTDIDLSNKIRQEQHRPVRDEYKNFDEVWEALQRMKGTLRLLMDETIIFNNKMSSVGNIIGQYLLWDICIFIVQNNRIKGKNLGLNY